MREKDCLKFREASTFMPSSQNISKPTTASDYRTCDHPVSAELYRASRRPTEKKPRDRGDTEASYTPKLS